MKIDEIKILRSKALLLFGKCPFCKKTHQHGAGKHESYKPNESAGTRVSHCLRLGGDSTPREYELIIDSNVVVLRE